MVATWILGGLALLAAAYTAWSIRRMTAPTRGRRIDTSSRPGTALLVIDMQEDFTRLQAGRDWSEADLLAAISSIRQLAREARSRGEPVIVIRHIMKGWWTNRLNSWANQGLGNQNSAGLGLDPRLQLPESAEFIKHIGDAFSSAVLEDYLAENRIGKLRLTGLDGCHCVHKTACGALNRGYEVEIVPSAILAADRAGWERVQDQLAKSGAKLRPFPSA